MKLSRWLTAFEDVAGVVSVPVVTLVSISVTPVSASLVAGQTQQLVATATYSDSSTADVSATATWSSSDASVATVDTAGLVTTLVAGTTTVSATIGSVSGSSAITVSAPLLIFSDQAFLGATGNIIGAASSYTNLTAVTPIANQPTFCAVFARRTAGVAAAPSVAGCNLTWTHIADVTLDTLATPTRMLSLFWGIGAAPTHGLVTATFGVNWDACTVAVLESMGRATSVRGANNVTARSDSTATPTATLGAFNYAYNATIVFVVAAAGVISPENGWTDLEGNFGVIDSWVMADYMLATADTTIAPTLSGATKCAFIATEIVHS